MHNLISAATVPGMTKEAFPVFDLLATPRRSGKDVAFDLIERQCGERPKESAFRNWKNAYGRIPPKFIIPLIYALNERKIPFDDVIFNSTKPEEKPNGKKSGGKKGKRPGGAKARNAKKPASRRVRAGA